MDIEGDVMIGGVLQSLNYSDPQVAQAPALVVDSASSAFVV